MSEPNKDAKKDEGVQTEGLDKGLTDEIGSAVSDVMDDLKRKREEDEPPKPEDEKKGKGTISGKEGDEPEKADGKTKKDDDASTKQAEGEPDGKQDEGDDGDEGKGRDGADAVTDEVIERAVKAGISIADAKTFTSKSSLERVCSILESKAKADDKSGDGDGKKEEVQTDGGDENPADAIPDLDPEEYDEKLVAGFKALKGLIGEQYKQIQALKASEAVARTTSEFESLMASHKDIEGEPRKAVETKFNLLTKAYKAAGEEVKAGDVLKEAIAIVIGKEASQAAEKTKKLEERKDQHIQRPSKTPGKPTENVEADIAAKIDEKFSNKT
jgi:hypothetical protein